MILKGYFLMSKKEYQTITGQICLNMNINVHNYVVQANKLISGKQNLKLNSAKILRTLIMQITPQDDEFKSYCISIPRLSKLLGISTDNLYRDMDSITDDILSNPVSIKDHELGEFVKIPWVTVCAYKKGIGFIAQMNPLLKPFLLNLQEKYTQYQLDSILAMKSVYAIRIFELIMKESIMKYIPKEGTSILLTIQEIREACSCEDKFERISNFKEKVLDVAVKEIERITMYTLSYDCVKSGRHIYAVRFSINMFYH